MREARGMPRRVIAEALGVSDAAVRDYELAEVRDAISLATFRRMAKVLGCDLMVALVPSDGLGKSASLPDRVSLPEAHHTGEAVGREPAVASWPRDGGELAEYLK